jgi:hypothetical protein
MVHHCVLTIEELTGKARFLRRLILWIGFRLLRPCVYYNIFSQKGMMGKLSLRSSGYWRLS